MSDPKDTNDPARPADTPTEPTAVTPAIASASLPRAPRPRGGLAERPSTATTEEELDTIERAIDHPPPKADHFGTALAVLGAVGFVLKTWSPAMSGTDMALVAAAIGLGSVQLARYVGALIAKTPNKDAAKDYIKRLRLAQGWTPPAESNREKLKRLLWKRLFSGLEKRAAPLDDARATSEEDASTKTHVRVKTPPTAKSEDASADEEFDELDAQHVDKKRKQ